MSTKRYCSDKTIDRAIKERLRRGWSVTIGKHLKLRTPSGRLIVMAHTPSDHRSIKNTLADLARAETQEMIHA